MMEPVQNLITQLTRLPGVGRKSAARLAYHILDMPEAAAGEIAEAILRAREAVHYCPVCGNYTDIDPCAVCADKTRRRDIICVVEDARDVASMEKVRGFRGVYHVLSGAISPMDGVGPEDIRIKELLERVDSGGVSEVILATDPDVEGEATAAYIAGLLRGRGVRATRIAHGIPIGGDLEYVDEMTLTKAVEGRRDM